MQAELIKDKHHKLLASNFGKTFEDLKSMREEDLDDFVLQELGMAESIVTILGNELCRLED